MVKKPTYEELEQKIRELEKESSEVRFRELFNNMSSGVAIYKAKENGNDYVFKDFNRGGERIENIKKEDLIGKNVLDVFPGVKEFGLFDVFRRVWETGKPEHHPISIYKDDRIMGWRDNYVYKLPSGEIVAVYDDVTERKRAEEALRKAHDELELRVEERTEDLSKANERLEGEMEVRKQIEEALQRSQKELQTIVDSVPALIAYKDTNNRYIRINKIYAEATSLPRDAIEGKSAFDIAKNRQVAESYWRDDKEVMESGIPKRGIIEPMLFDETRVGQTDKIPYRDDKDNIIGVILFCIDITSRVKAEAALKESEERYRTLIENVPVAVYRTVPGPKGKFMMANPTFLNMFGLDSEEELKEMTVADLYMNPEERKVVSSYMLTQKNVTEVETLLRKKDGTPFWGSGSASVVYDESGKAAYFDCTIMDITDRKQAEESLQDSERRYRTLVETMNDGLAVRDENNLIIYANKKFFEMIGYSNDDVIGRQVKNFLDDTNQKILQEQNARLRNGERTPYEIKWNRKDGKKIPTLVSPEPIHDAKGNFRGSFAVITDISELKQTEQLLRKKEQDLEIKTINLEEINTALRVLLKKREEDKKELEEKVMSNVKQLVEPYLEKLKSTQLDEKQKTFVDILESNLEDLISPFSRSLSSIYSGLTPTEIQVADLVKQGRSTKEIGELMNLSWKTIKTHRNNIRARLKLKNKKSNLRSYLLSIH